MADPVIRNALADIIYEELAYKEYIDMVDCIGAAAEILASRWITELEVKARADALEEAVRAVGNIPTADPHAYGESDPFGAHVSGWETAQEHARDAIRALIEKKPTPT